MLEGLHLTAVLGASRFWFALHCLSVRYHHGEMQRTLRKNSFVAYGSGKGCIKISKQTGISPSTVRKIIYKWRSTCQLPTCSRQFRPSRCQDAYRTLQKSKDVITGATGRSCHSWCPSACMCHWKQTTQVWLSWGACARRKTLLTKNTSRQDWSSPHLDKDYDFTQHTNKIMSYPEAVIYVYPQLFIQIHFERTLHVSHRWLN